MPLAGFRTIAHACVTPVQDMYGHDAMHYAEENGMNEAIEMIGDAR